MKRKLFTVVLLLVAVCTVWDASAQRDRTQSVIRLALKGLEYEIKAGFNIGGASPLPLPREIRKIDSYSPTMCFSIESNAIRWMGKKKKWGIEMALRFESKGMETRARVKNYNMEFFLDGSRMAGNWTGMVKTKYRSTLFSIPLLVAYKVNPRLRLHIGPYVSFQTNGDFSGHVYNGYIREANPTGPMTEIKGEKKGIYDFSKDLRTVQVGMQGGVAWKAFKHLVVSADLSWGLSDIFQPSFETISFPMYPIYLNIGFGYAF